MVRSETSSSSASSPAVMRPLAWRNINIERRRSALMAYLTIDDGRWTMGGNEIRTFTLLYPRLGLLSTAYRLPSTVRCPPRPDPVRQPHDSDHWVYAGRLREDAAVSYVQPPVAVNRPPSVYYALPW